MYPNPAKGVIHVDYRRESNATVTLFDNTGKAVMQQAATRAAASAIDVSALQPGLYFLQVKSGTDVYNEKVMVEQ